MIMPNKIATNGNIQTMAATLVVKQGYRTHSISLTGTDWASVSADQPICVRGAEYVCEGETFWDYWNFNATSAGSLRVEYADDGYVCFDGKLIDAAIEEHTLD